MEGSNLILFLGIFLPAKILKEYNMKDNFACSKFSYLS